MRTLPPGATIADHDRMRVFPAGLVTMVLCGAAQAGEQPTQPGRPLLQPPPLTIASPITDRFVVRAMYFRSTVSTTAR
jgi:hypothetical protein